MHRDKENRMKAKQCLTVKNIEKKKSKEEMHTKQNPANFKIKHREATRKREKNKTADTESNFNDQTLSQ